MISNKLKIGDLVELHDMQYMINQQCKTGDLFVSHRNDALFIILANKKHKMLLINLIKLKMRVNLLHILSSDIKIND